MVSLSVLIGLTTAVTVLIVAAVTLSITLTFSVDAIHSVGLKHTGALADLAGVQLDNYFQMPRDSANALAEIMRGADLPLPAEGADPRALADRIAEQTHTAYRAASESSSCLVALRDGSFIRALFHPFYPTTHTFVHRNVLVKNTTTGAPYIELKTWSFWRANGTKSPAGFADNIESPTTVAPLFWPAGRLNVMDTTILTGEDRNKIFLGPPVSGQIGTNPPFMQLSIYAAAYNSSLHSHGIVACGAGLSQLAGYLRAAKTSSGAELFVVGPDQRIMSSTLEPFYDVYQNVPRNRTAEPGCASTVETTAADPSKQVAWVCRYLFADAKYAAAREFSRQYSLTAQAKQVLLVKLNGENYFVATRQSALANVFGYITTLVIFIPEQDIIGQVRRGQAIAIGSSVAVFVVTVAVSWLIVVALLRPLQDIGNRMQRAASFEDEDVDRSLSAITEVRDLQTSYYALNDELTRVSAYVPQSVLARRYATSQDDEEGAGDPTDPLVALTGARRRRPPDWDSASVCSSRHSSAHSQHSMRSLRNAASVRGAGASGSSNNPRNNANRTVATAGQSQRQRTGTTPVEGSQSQRSSEGKPTVGLNIAVGLFDRVCSVLLLNCHGFNAKCRDASCGDFASAYCSFIQRIHDVIGSHHGVLDSFHGDRVMASFNGVRPIAQHFRRALQASLGITAAAVPMTLGLGVSCGVATGRCRMGNVGSATSKRFCIMGAAVTRASLLCDRGSAYIDDPVILKLCPGIPPPPPRSAILVAGDQTMLELQTWFALQTTDLARLPMAGGGRTSDYRTKFTIVSRVLAEIPEAQSQEWLYVVDQGSQATSLAGQIDAAYRLALEDRLDDASRMCDSADKTLQDANATVTPPTLDRLRAYLKNAFSMQTTAAPVAETGGAASASPAMRSPTGRTADGESVRSAAAAPPAHPVAYGGGNGSRGGARYVTAGGGGDVEYATPEEVDRPSAEGPLSPVATADPDDVRSGHPNAVG